MKHISIEDFCNLPLSKAIRIALDDVAHQVMAQGLKVDMDCWGKLKVGPRNEPRELCSVCFAGAVVLSRSLNPKYSYLLPDLETGVPDHVSLEMLMDYSSNLIGRIALTLDSLRRGNVLSALRVWLGNPTFQDMQVLDIYELPGWEGTVTGADLEEFMMIMKGISVELEKLGY